MAAEPENSTTTAKKKPLSLNEHHTLLLSSTRSKPPPPSTSSFFSLGEEFAPSMATSLQDNRRPFKLPPPVEDDIPNFSGIADFDSPIGNEKLRKVKIQGRRRLCKVVAATSNDCPSIVTTEEKTREGADLDISDLRSPPTARFDLLSVDKKLIRRPAEHRPVPVEEEWGDDASPGSSFSKASNSSGSSSDAVMFRRPAEYRPVPMEEEWGDYASPAFSKASNSSGSSSDAAKRVVEKEEADSEHSEAEGYQCVAKKDLHKTKVENESDASHRGYVPSVSNDDEDSDDDCVIVETGNLRGGKKVDSHLLKEKFGDSKVADILDTDDSKEAGSEDEHVIALKGLKSTFRLSGKIGKMLYPHQRDGLKWLWYLHCQEKGGILGDDMGLGKTMQICGFLAGLFDSRLIKRVAVVAPKTLIPHWIKELGVVGLSRRTREFCGTSAQARQYELQYVLQDGGIILTTYDIVRNNFKQLCQSNSLGDDSDEDEPIWDYMILDEGHLIKNPSTQRAQSLLAVPCAHRIIISGTPIQNNLKELWALFHFCCPDLLRDKKWFKERYENPILRGNDKKATEWEKLIGSTVAKELREHIQPYFLRRLKSEVFNEKSETGDVKLSKKNELIVWLRLTSVQRHLYEACLNSELVLSSFDGSPLAAITILKKICDHPYLLTKRAADEVLVGMDSTLNGEDLDLATKLAKRMAEFSEESDFQEEHDNVSCKISFIMSLLANLIPQGHNVLIFSQTRKMLNYIQESLGSNGYLYQRIDGTTKACDRLSIVNDFQEGRGAPIFLLTSQVGGLGLTLTKADRVIVVDPAWNPSMDSQSVDRAYRIGQKKDVLVYRLMTCSTIEEKIYRMQIFKGGLFKTATEQKEQTRYFSKQDLKELFSLPKDGFDVSPTQQQLYEEHHDQIERLSEGSLEVS